MTVPVDLAEGHWLNRPRTYSVDSTGMTATAARGSDFWRGTYYGFTRDTGHALLFDLHPGSALQMAVTTNPEAQFDQAGLLVRRGAEQWVKAGVEVVDGEVCAGAVVTAGMSDWSTHPAHWWQPDAPFELRVSHDRDALVFRLRVPGGRWRLLRVCALPGEGPVTAGPYLCAPQSTGFSARFSDLQRTSADHELH